MRALYRFLKDEVFFRGWEIASYSHLWIAAYLGFGIVYPQYLLGKIEPKLTFEFLQDKMFDYDITVFGFSIAAIAIVIAIPAGKYLDALRKSQEATGRSALNQMLFLLTWNAVVHFFAFVLIVIASAFLDKQTSLSQIQGVSMQVFIAIALIIQIYSIVQFVITIVSVFKIANMYANQIKN